ncbi:hypothetical protein L6452_42779 [Arctium lappa]|uniref:Uncharacterized protein n=1 Tax=Arctium lappa TaxID=4217 RepID=A0ACB8XKZ1_ARCLA|nr:hypothetical protein L6452_42779 [Arctium lappa]
MADEFNNSNPPTLLLGAPHNITNQNATVSESVFTGSWGSSSSSSVLNTSFGSDLDSSETDNDEDEFIAELTRQMADYMLQEDDDDDVNNNNTKSISQVTNQNQNRVELKSRRRKGKMTESTKQQIKLSSSGVGGLGRVRQVGYGPLTPVGSGMRAIFLNGSGSNSRSSGTGVFLPRLATDATAQNRKKPGCSTVLVPTRVLQALEQHFNSKDSLLSSSDLLHIQPNHHGQRSGLQQKLQVRSTSSDHLDRKLPQEWTY